VSFEGVLIQPRWFELQKNEQDWFAETDLDVLMNALDVHLADRKLRLFACHSIRMLDTVVLPKTEESIRIVEQALDYQIPWMTAAKTVGRRPSPSKMPNNSEITLDDLALMITQDLVRSPIIAFRHSTALSARILSSPVSELGSIFNDDAGWWYEYHRNPSSKDIDASRFLPAFHDIVGNPFRSVSFDPAWRTSAAIGLASTMYDARNFNAMPILADALQDAGCEDESILSHCRDENELHVRGCWVVDLVLGKK
jgi:hypothetical protein